MQLKRFSKYIFLGLNGAAKPSAVCQDIQHLLIDHNCHIKRLRRIKHTSQFSIQLMLPRKIFFPAVSR